MVRVWGVWPLGDGTHIWVFRDCLPVRAYSVCVCVCVCVCTLCGVWIFVVFVCCCCGSLGCRLVGLLSGVSGLSLLWEAGAVPTLAVQRALY